jgi:putative FmdB family regulatory protein
MPLYEYSCKDCGIEFEALVLSARMLEQIDCPKCLSKSIELLASTFSFKFQDNALGSYRGSCSNPYENLTLQHVRNEQGEPVKVNSLKELREAEKKYNFTHAVSSDDHIDLPPQNESWAGDVRHGYKWKWTPPEDRNDMSGVTVGAIDREKLLLGG